MHRLTTGSSVVETSSEGSLEASYGGPSVTLTSWVREGNSGRAELASSRLVDVGGSGSRRLVVTSDAGEAVKKRVEMSAVRDPKYVARHERDVVADHFLTGVQGYVEISASSCLSGDSGPIGNDARGILAHVVQ